MSGRPASPDELSPPMAEAFTLALEAVQSARIPYSVGGALAMHFYAGTRRAVKDLDLHILPEDLERALEALREKDFITRIRHPQWLAQAFKGDFQVDLVFGMGNWIAEVDRDWIDRGRPGQLLGHEVVFAPPEEIIWSKAFMCSRERYDAADIFHLLVAVGPTLNWEHLLARFGEHWEVLLSHLVMFRYVYPSHAAVVPEGVLDALLGRLDASRRRQWEGPKLCRGTLLDGAGAYFPDVTEGGYLDARQELWEQRQAAQLGQRHHNA